MRKSCVLLLAMLTPLAAEVSLGRYYTQPDSATTFILTPWSNRPLPGFAGELPPEMLKQGILVSVRSADSTTAAYQVTLRYRSGAADMIITAVLHRTGLWSSTLFEIGQVPVVSVTVTELAARATMQVSE